MDMQIIDQAIQKLTVERDIKSGDSKAQAIAKPTADALIRFCGQSDVFAAAVVGGGSFEECCEAVAKGLGSAVSDFDVYAAAVQHYMPDAKIECEMRIITAAQKPDEPSNIISLSLADFL